NNYTIDHCSATELVAHIDNLIQDPVSLSCNHSFCSSCLNKFWEQTGNKNCPICKRHSSKEFLPVNFGLKDLSDTFAGRQESESSETEREERHPMVFCTEHQEDPKLFCKDEQRAVCPVCDISLHQSHKLVPIEQAVSELKEQLKSDLKYLQDKRNKHKELEKTYDDIIQYSKNKLLSTESQIRAEFNKLHQFLREEEESRLAALREEEEQKGKTISREMKRIQEQISSLSDSISAVEEDLQKDQVSFLSSYKATQSRARAQSSLSDPQLVSGGLIDVHFNKWQQLPDNPERNTETPSVFGSEGFSSGKHSWDVEVGDHPIWNIGLVKESANRKGERYASPKYGIWCLWHRDGKYSASGKNLSVNKSVQRIRVQLDYDSGEVSFYDREDMSHILVKVMKVTSKIILFILGHKMTCGPLAEF
uniref:Uncharacterized protein n=1 Tax=Cyprinodon variegatus TaxID=28743 RepID=A0A3Q2GQQ5_CYPVA